MSTLRASALVESLQKVGTRQTFLPSSNNSRGYRRWADPQLSACGAKYR